MVSKASTIKSYTYCKPYPTKTTPVSAPRRARGRRRPPKHAHVSTHVARAHTHTMLHYDLDDELLMMT